jgi:hypothetical protein
MNKKLFVAGLALIAAASINSTKATAQSCPNTLTFGVHSTLPGDKTLQSLVEVTYFTTDDPNVFISETAGISRSGSYAHIDTNQFLARISQLEKQGVASIKKHEAVTSYLGEMAQSNLERSNTGDNAKLINAGFTSSNPNDLKSLDRQTEINVNKGFSSDGDYFRVGILSWFVDVNMNGGMKMLDYDGSILMKPGETAVFKLRSDNELKRAGAARSYIAVTMRSVTNANSASIERRRTTTSSN